MKKLNKILSSVLAVSMIISCLAINAFATQQARTYTVKTDKAGVALKAGDIVTVEVVADTLLHAANAGYYIYFDPEVFTIDTAAGGMGKPKKYIDTTWYNTMNAGDQVVGWYWGTTRTANQSAEEGWIMCSWGGNTDAGAGVEAENNQLNYTIGKYYLTVKDGAKTGSTQITVDGATYGWQEKTADPMTYVPATLTVGEPAPVLAEPTVNVETKTNGTTQGFLATCTVDSTIKPISGLKLALTDGTNNATKEYTFTKIEAGTAKYAVNVQNVPDGTTVTATGSAIVAE